MMRIIATLFCLFAAMSCAMSCTEDSSGVEDNVGDDSTTTTALISLNESSIELSPTDTYTLTATAQNSTIGITWSTSDSSVAEVFLGTVTAVGVGDAVISVTTENGDTATCSVSVTVGDYELIWSDEFDGTALDTSIWNVEINGNGCGNSELQYYTDSSDNIRVEDGNLIIEARKESMSWADYTSARITTDGNFDVAYGKIEAYIDLPAGGGVWPAFWMMGQGSWPSCGEIDILEYQGNNPGYVIHALHTSAANGTNGLNWSSNPKVDVEDGYHLFTVEWEECWWSNRDVIRFYVDGVLTGEKYDPVTTLDNSQWPYYDEFYILLNLAIGGTLGGTVDDTIFNDDVQMKVDYVRVYQRKK